MEFCEDKDSLYKREAELVNEHVLNDPMNMNLKLGGEGGWDHISQSTRSKSGIAGNKKHIELLKTDEDYRLSVSTKISSSLKQRYADGMMYVFSNDDRMKGSKNAQSLSAKEKRAKTRKEKQSGVGTKNSQFGTCWIYCEQTQQNKKINKNVLQDYLDQGWAKGMKVEYTKKNVDVA